MKEMGTPDVRIDTRLNKAVWSKGVRCEYNIYLSLFWLETLQCLYLFLIETLQCIKHCVFMFNQTKAGISHKNNLFTTHCYVKHFWDMV